MNRRISQSSRGFTLAELSIGMAITGIVLAALMSFTMTTATAWRTSQDEEAAATTANVATARVGATIRKARLAGAFRAGSLDNSSPEPACLLLWREDQNGDGLPQKSEVELIELDPAERTIYRYAPDASFSSVDWAVADVYTDASIDEVRKDSSRIPMVTRIDGMRIFRRDAGAAHRPAVEMQLRIDRGRRQNILAVTIALRSAAPSGE